MLAVNIAARISPSTVAPMLAKLYGATRDDFGHSGGRRSQNANGARRCRVAAASLHSKCTRARVKRFSKCAESRASPAAAVDDERRALGSPDFRATASLLPYVFWLDDSESRANGMRAGKQAEA